MDKQDITHTHTHTVEYYSALKKNDIMPFTATWMDSETMILSEVHQRQISYDGAFTWNPKKKNNQYILVNLLTIQVERNKLIEGSSSTFYIQVNDLTNFTLR